MSSNQPTTPPPPTTPSTPTATGPSGGVMWMIPALTFLAGVILGGVIIWVSTSSSRSNSGTGAAIPTVTKTLTPTDGTSVPGTAATLSVPAQCLKVADDSKAVMDLVNQSVAAARDLDASKLSDLVRQIQAAQKTLQTDAASCQHATASLPSAPTPATSAEATKSS